MKKVTPNAVERIKNVFLLGLSSNLTTVAGLILVWIIMARNEWVSGFIETLFMVLAFTPVFMADAINHYCLGRIRLEYLKGWDDVQITTEGREAVAKNHQVFRIMSIVPTYILAGFILARLGMSAEAELNARLIFLSAFIIHFFRSVWFLKSCVAPRLPSYGGRRLFFRTTVSAVAFYIWYVYFLSDIGGADVKTELIAASTIFANGIFYFLLNAFMQPLPTRFSLFHPGKAIRKEAFFSVEMLDDVQLEALHNAEEIKRIAQRAKESLDFKQIACLRVPLLELPLFLSWGILLFGPENKVAMLVLDSEVKHGVHRSFISVAESGAVFVSTDFNAPKAKFPDTVNYKTFSKGISDKELLQNHKNFVAKAQLSNLDKSFSGKLEDTIKEMIRFLETSSVTRGGPQIKAAVNIKEKQKDNEK